MRNIIKQHSDRIWKTFVWAFPLLAGFVLASIDGKRNWLGGFAGYSSLLLFSSLLLDALSRRLNTTNQISRLGFGIFWMRLILGVAMMGLLPVLGYQDSEVSQAGYVFQDAFTRDNQAWQLASSDNSLLNAFSGDFSGDQYGGLLFLSSATYRFVSPGFHRPLLVLIWIALAGAAASMILWRSVLDWLTGKEFDGEFIAKTAAVLFGFYPEAVLLGISHMRETAVMLGIAVLFRGYVLLNNSKSRWFIWVAVGVGLLLIFQAPLGLATLFVIVGLWIFEPEKKLNWKIILVFSVLILAAFVGSYFVMTSLPSLSNVSPSEVFQTWLIRNFNFQSHLSERSSGMLQKLFDTMGERFTVPIVIGYGVLQPVLPAVIVDPAALIWRVINILRSTGWYLLAPVLVYGLTSSLNSKVPSRRWQRLWLALVCFGWAVIAALNAGGDQWDNPRYRTLFLPWMAVLAGWVWSLAQQRKDPWIGRFLVVAGLFSVTFLEWYLSRYIPVLAHLDIRMTIVFSAVLIAGYLIGCVLWDYRKGKRNA